MLLFAVCVICNVLTFKSNLERISGIGFEIYESVGLVVIYGESARVVCSRDLIFRERDRSSRDNQLLIF